MDVSTIRRMINQRWAVDEDGHNKDLLTEQVDLTCDACQLPFGSWDGVVAHCRTVHSPEGVAAGNGVPTDGTSVATYHRVELEAPDAE